jgi:glycosyltransferase involved in cell wall biosynthesis
MSEAKKGGDVLSRMKVLCLFRDMPRPDDEELKRLEESDQIPRATMFTTELNALVLDRLALQRVPFLRRKLYRFLPLLTAQVIEAFLIRKQYDVVLSWYEKLGLPYALLCKIVNDRTVPHVAMCSWPGVGMKLPFLHFVQTHIDRFVLWSSVQRDIVLRKTRVPREKICFTKYYVDQKFFRPMPRETDMICSVGSEMRDFLTLLEALEALDIPCHIAAGTGHGLPTEWVSALERVKHYPSNVTIGRKNQRELRELYARSRFVVIPLLDSDTDNGITCILEAMAMGKTVICSRIRGQVDVIEEGKTGIFVPVGDSKALRDAILYLWNNPDVAERMGAAGRAYVEKFQTLDKFVHDIKESIESVLEERTLN